MKPTRTELLTAWMTLVKVRETYCHPEVDQYEQTVLIDVLKIAGQTTTNRGQEMIKKQLDKLLVPRFTGGAMIVAFLFGYVIGAILL
jgi:hypothetical protein